MKLLCKAWLQIVIILGITLLICIGIFGCVIRNSDGKHPGVEIFRIGDGISLRIPTDWDVTEMNSGEFVEDETAVFVKQDEGQDIDKASLTIRIERKRPKPSSGPRAGISDMDFYNSALIPNNEEKPVGDGWNQISKRDIKIGGLPGRTYAYQYVMDNSYSTASKPDPLAGTKMLWKGFYVVGKNYIYHIIFNGEKADVMKNISVYESALESVKVDID